MDNHQKPGPRYGAGQNVPCGGGHALLPSETDRILEELELIGWLLCFVLFYGDVTDGLLRILSGGKNGLTGGATGAVAYRYGLSQMGYGEGRC